jgi:hypothetical protein
MSNIVADFWIGNDRYFVIENNDSKGNEMYIAKVLSVTRDDRRKT